MNNRLGSFKPEIVPVIFAYNIIVTVGDVGNQHGLSNTIIDGVIHLNANSVIGVL